MSNPYIFEVVANGNHVGYILKERHDNRKFFAVVDGEKRAVELVQCRRYRKTADVRQRFLSVGEGNIVTVKTRDEWDLTVKKPVKSIDGRVTVRQTTATPVNTVRTVTTVKTVSGKTAGRMFRQTRSEFFRGAEVKILTDLLQLEQVESLDQFRALWKSPIVKSAIRREEARQARDFAEQQRLSGVVRHDIVTKDDV
jgi:adenosine/AMP kinase